MTIHFILMGKGGVGKSLVASFVAQYLNSKGRDTYCADTDPLNQSFKAILALNAEHIDIMNDDMDIDKGKFDPLVEKLLTHTGDVVIDTGASSFVAMMSYLRDNRIFEFLIENDKRIVIHCPLVGGAGMDATIRGLMTVLAFDGVSVVVWENSIQGPVVKDGASFQQSKLYKAGSEKILGVVKLIARSPEYVKGMLDMTKANLTFAEALDQPNLFSIERQRLTWIWRDITTQLDNLDL